MVQLNVGGHLYTTSLGTLRKYPDSKLAELFSGQPKLPTDAEGRYFIDRDGRRFRAILEFLRSDLLPTEEIREVGSPRGNVYRGSTPMDVFLVLSGPCRRGVLQHQATDQAFGGEPSAVWRTGGTTTVPVTAAALQRKHRGQIDGPRFYSCSVVLCSKHGSMVACYNVGDEAVIKN